ncbi:MAG: response regulator transcription factor [Kiritimatiellae bacterium]|jgi:DNA-binding NarL/FixJ family response regulator|nr:response regulator transcription factor [Kiritimatiellia bacterium]
MKYTEKITIPVAIVEDDERVLKSLTEILANDKQCICVGAYSSAEEAMVSIPKTPPNVALVDVNLPGMDGVSLVQQLAPKMPKTQFMILSVLSDTETIFKALAAGAHGYLLKPVRAKQLLEAVHDVYKGGSPITSSIARKIVKSFREPQEKPVDDAKEVSLGPREKEVLDLLTKGLAYKEIADKLGISRNTVMTVVQRIYQKLHVHSRGEAVAKFHGL